MQYAIVDKIKQEAFPGGNGICELCQREVFAKCGEDRVDHWAHKPKQKCDSWWETQTEWHRNWKKLFPLEMCEVAIQKEETKHRADVQTAKGTVIEFQHSPLSETAIYAREEFYGPNMYWVLHGENFTPDLIIQKSNFALSSNLFRLGIRVADLKKDHFPYRWFKPKARWLTDDQKIFFDFGDGYVYTIISYIDKAGGGICRGISVDAFVEMVTR